MSASSALKYEYCPDYDSFLCDSKQKLQERLVLHHNLREPLIHRAVANTVAKIEDLGYETYIDEIMPDYNFSFINHQQINKYIDEYRGPEISAKYRSNFADPSSSMYRKQIGFDKFHKDAVNWQDQSSYKVTGKYFFAPHIENINKYFTRYCQSIMDISEDKRADVVNYSCIYCAVQLLSTKIQFKRSKQQPLIRNTTLRSSAELHASFKILYNALDVAELKSIVKRNNKHDPTKKGGNKYRVNANRFAANLGIYSSILLNKEGDADSDEAVPDYFRDKHPDTARNAMIDMGVDSNYLPPAVELDNNYIAAPPKPSPPPKAVADCVCATRETFCDFPALPAPIMHRDGSRTVFVPLRVNQYGQPMHPMSNYYYPRPYYAATGYSNQRGGTYIGAARDYPYNSYDNMRHYGYENVPVLPAMNNAIDFSDACNYEDRSISSEATSSQLSHPFASSQDYLNSIM